MAYFVSLILNFKKTVSFTVIVIAVALNYFLFYQNESIAKRMVGVFSSRELMKYNGIDDKNLYLAIVGTVFDVTKGYQHYSKEGPYHYFVGKDGSRAFITGNFKDESDMKDHVLDLTCNNLLDLLHWKRTFKQKYKYVGILSGRYYDSNGEETEYMHSLKRKIKQCKLEKEEDKKQEQLYPPCNISWNENDGTQVWCTVSSGGVVRNWEGVPRQLFSPGKEKSHCVCVNDDNLNNTLLKEYEGCPSFATRCRINVSA